MVIVLLSFAVAWLLVWIVVCQPVFSGNVRSPLSVNPETLRNHVRILSEAFYPRDYRHTENLDRCADYIRAEFEKTGARVRFQEFSVAGRVYRNVIARFGEGDENLLVVGAHYDACGHTPGADDNASGAVGLIALASLLQSHPTGRNVELVAYTLEEPPFFRTPFMGSAVHARSLQENHTKIRGAVILEMIGCFRDEWMSQDFPSPLLRLFYPSRGNTIVIVGRLDQRAFVRALKKKMKGATGLPVYSVNAPAALGGVLNWMANFLGVEKQATAIALLAEGNSIRSVERVTGIHRDTVMRLGVRVGRSCKAMLHEKMKGLPCRAVQVDELWGFIQKKESRKMRHEPDSVGEVWTYLAICQETKIIPSFVVGKRDRYHTRLFMDDLASRISRRVQISSDGMDAYVEAVDNSFGSEVDYGQVMKPISMFVPEEKRRYSPGPIKSIYKRPMLGKPHMPSISTSIIERANLTMRHHCKRLARLTLGFSKKLENFEANVALVIAYYNMVKFHGTIRMTPAMACGVESRPWTVKDLISL